MRKDLISSVYLSLWFSLNGSSSHSHIWIGFHQFCALFGQCFHCSVPLCWVQPGASSHNKPEFINVHFLSSVRLWLPGSPVQHSTHFTGIKGEACGEAETELRNVSVITARDDGGRKGTWGQRIGPPPLLGQLHPGPLEVVVVSIIKALITTWLLLMDSYYHRGAPLLPEPIGI